MDLAKIYRLKMKCKQWKVERNGRSLHFIYITFRIDRYFDRIILNKSDCCPLDDGLSSYGLFIILNVCLCVCVWCYEFFKLIGTELSVHSSFGRHSNGRFIYKWNAQVSVDVMGPHQTLVIYFIEIIFLCFMLTRLRKHFLITFFISSAPKLSSWLFNWRLISFSVY